MTYVPWYLTRAMNPQLLQHLDLYDDPPDNIDDSVKIATDKVVESEDASLPPQEEEEDKAPPSWWRGRADAMTFLHLAVLILSVCGVSASFENSAVMSTIVLILIAFVLGNSVPAFVLVPMGWTKQDDNNTRCQINTMLGSIGAPPLSETNNSLSASPKQAVDTALLNMVKGYGAWVEAAAHTLETLRTATALDLGRTTTLTSSSYSPVVDRLELSALGRRTRTRRIPLYRLRLELWRLLERQRSALEALLVADDDDDERCLGEWTNVARKEQPRVITLSELRIGCGITGQVLSKVTNHLLAGEAANLGKILAQIQDVTRQAQEARAYLECWLPQKKNEDDQSSSVVNDWNSIEESFETLQVALQCLRESHQHEPAAATTSDHQREQWTSFRRVFASLDEKVKRMEQTYLWEDESSLESEDNDQQKEPPRTSVGVPTPELNEYCSKSEHGVVTITDRPKTRDEDVDISATLVFAGQGTRDLQQARSVPKKNKRPNNSAASAQRRPDPFVSEQNMLDELRRHLTAMPSLQEVEINVDGEIVEASSKAATPRTQEMISLNATEEEHNESILFSHVASTMVVNDLTAAIRLIQPPSEEYTME